MDKALRVILHYFTRISARPPEGTHWKKGFAFARPVLESGAIVNTCCLKTHSFGGHFTLSLKNSVGMVAKYVPGDSFKEQKINNLCVLAVLRNGFVIPFRKIVIKNNR